MPKHIERRHLPYTARQVFDLVADVEKYPDFIEWFVAARIRHRNGNVLEVHQVVRFAGLRRAFTTQAILDPPRRIVITTSDPPFRSFDQRWTFTPATDGGTTVEYETTVEMRSGFLQRLMRLVFDERQIAEATVNAFRRRADQIYGRPRAAD
jgi:coenzyme Q-binding protein COQ10